MHVYFNHKKSAILKQRSGRPGSTNWPTLHEKIVFEQRQQKVSREADLNHRPKDDYEIFHYSPPLYQLSYRGKILNFRYLGYLCLSEFSVNGLGTYLMKW